MGGQKYSKFQGSIHFFVTLQEIKTKNEELAREIELLAQKLEELEQLSRGRGLLGTLNFRHTRVSEDRKSNWLLQLLSIAHRFWLTSNTSWCGKKHDIDNVQMGYCILYMEVQSELKPNFRCGEGLWGFFFWEGLWGLILFIRNKTKLYNTFMNAFFLKISFPGTNSAC